MAHMIETIAYANETPWHGLGTRVDSSISVDDMLVAAGLDWEVEMRPMFTASSTGAMMPVKSKAALVRSTDDKILTVASPAWKPLQNRDALEYFREFTESGGAKLETAGSLRGGKMIWALAKIDRNFRLKNDHRDVTSGYILLSSPHQVGESIKIRTTATRVVCANTFAVADRGIAQYTQGHLVEFNKDAAREAIQLSVDHVARMEDEANKLAAVAIGDKDVARFYSQLLQPVQEGFDSDVFIEDLLTFEGSRNPAFAGAWNSYTDAPGATPGTLWGVFNGLTHWADHTAGRDAAARLNSAWFGSRAELKQKAYSQLLEMAE